jgi:8-oxo-dGTP pyrophosphatase MutT (NUDIX family)
MSWRPELTVAAVIEREQRFLIVEERISGARVFNQPAGHVETGEALLAAVIRETREETAWEFLPTSLTGMYLWRNPRTARYTLRFAFTGELRHHDPGQSLDRPVIGTHWLSRGDLLAREPQLRTPLVLRCIDDYLAGHRLPLSAVPTITDAALVAG